jgi:hypothetical protein
METKER